MPNVSGDNFAISFGSFRFEPEQRLLFESDQPIRLGSRALDILIALLERNGDLVSKRELMSIVWPDTNVVEANLTVHLTALRRALGDGQAGRRYIVNNPGRGYCFVAPIAKLEQPDKRGPAQSGYLSPVRPHNLPAQLTRLIGRQDVIDRVLEQLPRHRLISIVGPGGIGKTAAALNVAERLIEAYEHGVWLIDLAPISDPTLVSVAVASTLSLETRSGNLLPVLVDALRNKQILLVFDNCEHVIETAASLVLSILKAAPNVHILATSREPLRVEGERVHRLLPLESPPPSVKPGAADVLNFPAVQLLVQRAAETAVDFQLNDDDAPYAAEICRRLDGIPLAIEFAAAHIETLGVSGLAARFHRQRLLTTSRRAVEPRHRSINAALDWSYQLLNAAEQTIFRRLAIFSGGFTLSAVHGIVSDTHISGDAASSCVLEFVTKSLVATYHRGAEPRFRLLEPIREFALFKLAESTERNNVERRHAEYYRDLLFGTDTDQSISLNSVFSQEIDNIRAALNWAFSPEGDTAVGVALAAGSASAWLATSLLPECRIWMTKAVANLNDTIRGTRQEMLIQAALGISFMYSDGMSEETYLAFDRTGDLAEQEQDHDHALNAFVLMWARQIRAPELQKALEHAKRCAMIAQRIDDKGAMSTADWMTGLAYHHLAEYDAAKIHLQRSLQQDSEEKRQAFIDQYGYDRRSAALATLSNLLWLQGFPDQALSTSSYAVEEARALGWSVPLCVALTWHNFNTYLTGVNLSVFEGFAHELADLSARHSLESYHGFGKCMLGLCEFARGESTKAQALLLDGLDQLSRSQYESFHPVLIGALAQVMSSIGFARKGYALMDTWLQKERNARHWCQPEFLRYQGEVLLSLGGNNAAAAEEKFLAALECAREQHALSWELRAAISLEKLRGARSSKTDANAILDSVYKKFTEGFETADLVVARKLLSKRASNGRAAKRGSPP